MVKVAFVFNFVFISRREVAAEHAASKERLAAVLKAGAGVFS